MKAQLLAIVVATLLSTKLKTEESVAVYSLQAVLRQFSYNQSDVLITGNTTCLSALVEKKTAWVRGATRSLPELKGCSFRVGAN